MTISDSQKKASRKYEEKNRTKVTIQNYKRTARMFITKHASKTDLIELKALISKKEKEQ